MAGASDCRIQRDAWDKKRRGGSTGMDLKKTTKSPYGARKKKKWWRMN